MKKAFKRNRPAIVPQRSIAPFPGAVLRALMRLKAPSIPASTATCAAAAGLGRMADFSALKHKLGKLFALSKGMKYSQ
ncbi:hypothetical protein AB7A53_006082 [Pseudomonas aeruginosa]|uniref:hypothetical protein n=1 Tax=Pseudomonas aeruginosa group TaxID=136841 RepID=UPI0010486378|nr:MULTISPECIES: hypothetical protein [Pseudomonas aeruginosa group]EJB8514944.1 hypothetical protein [Pseudomonas aeruginosa]EKU4832178.1 hypothetical protein [Pseudomonas aeruginosa]EKU7804082.1 hypothetical protein [Pseudomonas aeruginosa]EKW2948366.1 hypothetical protein [Pseudomonas aeruginosa]EKX4698247.1 hypothetical protein [Pseudomonas aeruginosa]